MNQQIVQQDNYINEEILNTYLKNMGNNLKESHKNQFIQIAKAFQLNPFIREIYGIPYGNNFNIIVGYETYLKRAERSGKLKGWKTEIFKEDNELVAKITIHRHDWDYPLEHQVYFSEYAQNSQIWKTKPKTMIRKVVIAQGMRLAFPDELGGMPYTQEELPDLKQAEIIKHSSLSPLKQINIEIAELEKEGKKKAAEINLLENDKNFTDDKKLALLKKEKKALLSKYSKKIFKRKELLEGKNA